MTYDLRKSIIQRMDSRQPFRRYVLVGYREDSPGVRRLRLARVTGVLPIASSAAPEHAKGRRT